MWNIFDGSAKGISNLQNILITFCSFIGSKVHDISIIYIYLHLKRLPDKNDFVMSYLGMALQITISI